MSLLTLATATELRAAGLRWTPSPGDRFVVPNRDMDDDVFVLSDMTVEVHDFPTGKVIGFNGVTEWALDSLEQEEVVWIPSEQQLRERLGGLFTSLGSDVEGFTVTVTLPDGPRSHRSGSAAEAYGRALLDVLQMVTAST